MLIQSLVLGTWYLCTDIVRVVAVASRLRFLRPGILHSVSLVNDSAGGVTPWMQGSSRAASLPKK